MAVRRTLHIEISNKIPMFSAWISPIDLGFNFYEIFAPDLMHKFELGVWKGIFTYLMCLLNTTPRVPMRSKSLIAGELRYYCWDFMCWH